MVTGLFVFASSKDSCTGSSEIFLLANVRTSKGDYCMKQWFSTITSLFKMGTSLKVLPEGANSFLKEQFLMVWKKNISIQYLLRRSF